MEQEVNHEIEGGVKNELEGSKEQSWREVLYKVEGEVNHELEGGVKEWSGREVCHEVEGTYVIKWKESDGQNGRGSMWRESDEWSGREIKNKMEGKAINWNGIERKNKNERVSDERNHEMEGGVMNEMEGKWWTKWREVTNEMEGSYERSGRENNKWNGRDGSNKRSWRGK